MKQIFNLTLQLIANKLRKLAPMLVFALFLETHSFTYAQPCNLLATFPFTVTGCDVEFHPYSNGSGMTHFWTFSTIGVGLTSSSNLATPIHTFGASTMGIRTVHRNENKNKYLVVNALKIKFFIFHL